MGQKERIEEGHPLWEGLWSRKETRTHSNQGGLDV
jgi:hypothetical protein